MRSSFQAVASFGKCPTPWGIISPTLYFHHPLGLGWLYFLYRLFPSGYKCSCKFIINLHEWMNEWKKREPYLLTCLCRWQLWKSVCVFVLLLLLQQISELSESLWPSLSLSLSSLSSPLPTKPNQRRCSRNILFSLIISPTPNPIQWSENLYLVHEPFSFFLLFFSLQFIHVCRKNVNWKKKEERKEVKEGKK